MEFHEKCPNCGAERIEGAVYCNNCGRPFGDKKSDREPEESKPDRSGEPIKPVFSSEPPPSDEERKYVAWEDRENKNFFEALWETWKESVFYPEKFYAKLPYRGGLGNPLLYAIIVGWVGIGIYQIYSIFWSSAWTSFLSRFSEFENIAYRSGIQSLGSLLYIVAAPFFIIIGLFIMAGVLHLVFLIFGWSKRDFEATFRALAYAEGATLFMVVPFCGGMISFVWGIVLAIIGLKHMQKTTAGKAALVYFLPVIVCCCLIAGIAILMSIIFGAAFYDSFSNEFGRSFQNLIAQYLMVR